MFVAGPELGAAVRGMVEARGIAYHPEHQVKEVDAANRSISFANGASAEYDLLLYVPPHRAPAVVREAGLTNDSGWVPVDRHTMQTQFENVFAIGDIATIPLKMGRPLPKAGVFAQGKPRSWRAASPMPGLARRAAPIHRRGHVLHRNRRRSRRHR